MRDKDFKLNSLLEITNAINTHQSVDQFIQTFEFILREQLGYKRFILFNHQSHWNCLLRVGVRSKVKGIDIEKELFRFKEITIIESSNYELINEFDLVIPVFHNGKPLAYLLLADIIKNPNKLSTDFGELAFVQTLTNIIVVAIENQRLNKQQIKQERLKKELEVASELQRLLFPSELPSNRRMDISAKYKSRHEVGGDYYDFIPLGDDEYVFMIADVSGKGISAAMLMANFQATIRTMFKYQRFELEFMLEELNKKVMRSAKGEKHITFFIAHYNANNRELKYVNAGHNHPVLTNGRKAQLLTEGCIGLGMMDELPFIHVGRTVLKPNTTIALYTDGVVELENDEQEFFGVERLMKLIHNYYPLKMEDLNNFIFSKLDEWKGSNAFDDDTAILTCRFY